MTLTSAQRRTLKSRGQTMGDDARIPGDGLNDATLRHILELLTRRDLIKVRFELLEGPQRKAFASQLAQAANAQLVGVVGRTALLYRPPAESATM
jgi:RNA-binding protein